VSVGKGSYVNRSSLTVYEHVRARIEQWQTLDKITPKTAERYRELLENQIAPHIGEAPLQKLKPVDIERWPATLKARGRKDGGKLSARTIRHAHRLLSKALKEAMRHDLVVRNAAAAEPPPQVEAEEVDLTVSRSSRWLRGCAVAQCIPAPSQRCSLECDVGSCWRCVGAMLS